MTTLSNVDEAGVGGEEGLEGTVEVAKDTVLRIGVLTPVVLSSFARGGGSTLRVSNLSSFTHSSNRLL